MKAIGDLLDAELLVDVQRPQELLDRPAVFGLDQLHLAGTEDNLLFHTGEVRRQCFRLSTPKLYGYQLVVPTPTVPSDD